MVYDKLCEIVSTAQCIIVADAIVNDHVIEFLERCRPNEKFNYIQVAQVNEGKEAIIYESEAALFHHILNSVIINNHNVWITCDTASKVEELAKTFNQHGDHINCLAITGPTQGNTNQVNFVKNPEEESKKYNVVIASSVISSGLSIQHDHFNFVAGFFSGNTIKPTDAYQMIGRVRQCKEFRLALNQKQKIEIKAHRILHGKQQASVLEDGVAANITAFSRMRANLIEAQYKALSNFANGFIYILEQKCFTIKHKLTNSEGTDFIEDPNIRKIKDDTSNEYKNALKEACPINDSMAQKLKNRSYLDEIERLELKAWQIKKDLGYPCEHVLSDQDLSISPDQINRFSAVIGRYKPSNDKEKDITSRNYNKALSKMYSIIFEDINLTAGAIFYTQCAHEILERAFQHRFTLVALDAIPRYFGKENYKLNKKNSVKALKNILEHLGITAKRKRNSRKVVQMAIYLYRKNTSCVQLSELESESHCYEITQSSMELMQQYSDMKFNSENVMAGNEVHQTELDDATYDILKNTTKLGARSINLEEVNRHSRATTSIINKAANSSEIHYLDAQGF